MSHERRTRAPPGADDFASSPPPSAQQFTKTSGAFQRNNAQLTPMERWVMDRSDDSFRVLAGATGGFMSAIVTCPLDVIKTKLQAQGGFRINKPTTSAVYSGLIGTGRVIWREEGFRGLYRGLGPIILGYVPTWAVWFTVYGKSKEFISKHHPTENAVQVNFWSSIVAGASSTMVTNPIWVIKTRLMSQVSRKAVSNDSRPPWYYKSTLDAAKKMYRTEGILSFYSGLTPALLGLSHVAIQFPAYEYLKTTFTGQPMGVSVEGDERSHWIGVTSASILSKVLASSATYPHEVIRTRLQTQQRALPSSSSEYAAFRGGLEGSENHGPAAIISNPKAAIPRYKGIITTFRTILREEGWRAFYAGMGTNMMRAVPAATTTILTYEYVMRHLNHTKAEAIRKTSNGW